MPSSVNQTNIQSTTNSTASVSTRTSTRNNMSAATASWYDPAGDLGYGVGRLLRGVFDLAYSAWESWWNLNSGPSLEEIAQRQQAIYLAGLKECIHHLKSALENVRKNPQDPASLGKINDLAQHYAAYVNVASTVELNVVRQQLFQPISEQVERLSNPALKRKLKMLLPVLTMNFSGQENKKTSFSVQDDEYSVVLSQSYYDEESAFKKLPEFSRSKEKRSTQQTLTPTPATANQQPFPAVFDLSTLNDINGFTIPAVASGGQLGSYVSTAGDINGDNITDLVLGAFHANSNYGAAYVIFGSRSGFGSSLNLTTLNGSNGFVVPGIAPGGYLGRSVGTAGDINGDGIADLVLGAVWANSLNGAAYVIFGSRSGFGSSLDLTTLNGSNGFVVPGVSGGQLGVSVNTAGDINGDNITDIVLGANTNYGITYVIFGSRSGFGSSFNLTALNGSNGFMVPGVSSGGELGSSVSTAGDINGDNITDLVLGAWRANSGNGTAYVIFGGRGGFTSPFNLTNLNGSNGFTVPGIASGGQLGYSVNTAGDINGDNIMDLVLGAYFANSNNGTAYVIFGSRSGFGSSLDLTALNGSNGFTVQGVASGGQLGVSVSTAGDVNGDNIMDLVLGAWQANSQNGAAYVIFGSRGRFGSILDLTTLNSASGFTVSGVASGDNLGISVSMAGDINGDNITDLVFGADGANSANGAAYVIFGQNTSAIFCPVGQTLILQNNDIQINKGQTLRLTPNDLSASCGNNTAPNLGALFTITGINHAQFKTRNSSGFWNNASNFLGTDLSEGNVALIQDNSTFAPELNISVTNGQTTLNSPVTIQFNTNQSIPQITNIAFTINVTGTTILNASQFQITDTGTNLDNVVISISSSQGGYFSTTSNSTQPITDFTYYQLQTGQIQFVQNGTGLPTITLSIGDGSGPPVLFRPLVSFFNTNNPSTPSVPIGAIAGAVAGAAAVGLTVFGLFKWRQNQERRKEQEEKAAAPPIRNLASVATPLQRKGN